MQPRKCARHPCITFAQSRNKIPWPASNSLRALCAVGIVEHVVLLGAPVSVEAGRLAASSTRTAPPTGCSRCSSGALASSLRACASSARQRAQPRRRAARAAVQARAHLLCAPAPACSCSCAGERSYQLATCTARCGTGCCYSMRGPRATHFACTCAVACARLSCKASAQDQDRRQGCLQGRARPLARARGGR
jgi:hypothetical protein